MESQKTKICNTCGLEKNITEFHKMKRGKDGVRTTCKECRKIEKKEYTSQDYVIEKQKKYYQEHKETIRKRLNKHYWTLNAQYHEYKKRAKKRNLEFELTENDCKNFYNTKCYYCNDDIKGMGIDRLDSNIGYVLNNLVPCCSKCNYMKHVMNKYEFIKHMKKILNNLNIKL
jgi:hypothetical protein